MDLSVLFAFFKRTALNFSKEKYKDTNHPMNPVTVWQQQSSSQQKCELKLFSSILVVEVEYVFYPYFFFHKLLGTFRINDAE